MRDNTSPKISLEQVVEYIHRDSAVWEGISLFYAPMPGIEKEPFKTTAETFIRNNPDALLFESKDKSIMVLGAKQAPEMAYEEQNHCLWVENIAEKWSQVCSALGGFIAKKTANQNARDENRRCSILIVEDDPLMNKMMEHHLSRFGTVIATSNYHQATANYMVQKPDIVFLDIHYKGNDMDGFDALRNILIADENAYIIMVSGDGQLQTRLEAMRLGARGFVAKPFSASHFTHYISKITS